MPERHRHYWTMDGPHRDRTKWNSGISTAISGRKCNSCDARDERPVCCEYVVTSDGRMTYFNRCENTASLTYAPEEPGSRDDHDRCYVPADEDGLWHYCKTHHPPTRAARDAAKPPTQLERDMARSRRQRTLIEAALAWDPDEQATEGFCEDEICEHHECNLHRAVVYYQDTTKGYDR